MCLSLVLFFVIYPFLLSLNEDSPFILMDSIFHAFAKISIHKKSKNKALPSHLLFYRRFVYFIYFCEAYFNFQISTTKYEV